jgi:hypothetical protein
LDLEINLHKIPLEFLETTEFWNSKGKFEGEIIKISKGAASEKKIFVPWEKIDKKDKRKDKKDKIFPLIFLMKLLITAFFQRILLSLPSKASIFSNQHKKTDIKTINCY